MTKTATAHGRLKAARDALGYSQEKMARHVGCTLRWYQEIEGGRKAPSLSLAVYMEPITGISPVDWVEATSGGVDSWINQGR